MLEPRTKDILFLNELSELLQSDETESFVLEKAYALVFQDQLGRNRVFRFTDPVNWENRQLLRALLLTIKIIARYTQLFQDPHAIPVTHYKRQKNLAIHLDLEFARLLKERVRRAKVLGMLDEQGEVIRDAVLDTPILNLKQEARGKNFPKNKKGGVASLKKLEERFESKLLAKGIRLVDERDPDQDVSERFTYGP